MYTNDSFYLQAISKLLIVIWWIDFIMEFVFYNHSELVSFWIILFRALFLTFYTYKVDFSCRMAFTGKSMLCTCCSSLVPLLLHRARNCRRSSRLYDKFDLIQEQILVWPWTSNQPRVQSLVRTQNIHFLFSFELRFHYLGYF